MRYVLKVDPVYTVSIENLALLQLRRQRYDEALVLYQRLVALDADNAQAWSGMGIALYYLGRTDEAVQSVDRALALDPTLEAARVNRAAHAGELAAKRAIRPLPGEFLSRAENLMPFLHQVFVPFGDFYDQVG